MEWYAAVIAGIGLALDAVGAVILAWGLINLPKAGFRGGGFGGGGVYPDDHSRQIAQRWQRRRYQAAATLLVTGFAMQAIGLGFVAT